MLTANLKHPEQQSKDNELSTNSLGRLVYLISKKAALLQPIADAFETYSQLNGDMYAMSIYVKRQRALAALEELNAMLEITPNYTNEILEIMAAMPD